MNDVPWKGRVLRTARRVPDEHGRKHALLLSVFASPKVWCVLCVVGRSCGRVAEEQVLVVPTRWLLFTLGFEDAQLHAETSAHRLGALASALVAQLKLTADGCVRFQDTLASSSGGDTLARVFKVKHCRAASEKKGGVSAAETLTGPAGV